MAPDTDATAGTPKGWHDLKAVLAEEPVARLLAAYLVVHPASYAALGRSAMPGWRRGRWRRRWPQWKGWRWAFQYSVACAIASVTSSQVSKRRPARASERSIFHHGSMRLR